MYVGFKRIKLEMDIAIALIEEREMAERLAREESGD